MPFSELLLLLLLSAIWGASFIFMRILAPVLGPVVTADLRVLIAGVTLLPVLKMRGVDPRWRENGKRYLIIGLLNSGIPFILFSFAALYLPASVSVIVNSMTPLFGAVGAILWLDQKPTVRTALGIALGIAGVAVIRGGATVPKDTMATIGLLACVLATMLYGAGGIYVKKKAHDIGPLAISAGSQLMIGILFLPLTFLFPPRAEVTPHILVLTAAFAILCSAVAYIIYYRLLKSLGPVKASTVTFLIPVFGFVWGALFLGESVTLSMVIGGAIVLSAIAFVSAPAKNK